MLFLPSYPPFFGEVSVSEFMWFQPGCQLDLGFPPTRAHCTQEWRFDPGLDNHNSPFQ